MSKKKALDAVDVAILKALQADASMTNQAIGELVGLTPGPTHSRIKRPKSTQERLLQAQPVPH